MKSSKSIMFKEFNNSLDLNIKQIMKQYNIRYYYILFYYKIQ